MENLKTKTSRILKIVWSEWKSILHTTTIFILVSVSIMQAIRINTLREQNAEIARYTDAVKQQNKQLDSLTSVLTEQLNESEISLYRIKTKQ